MDNDALDSMDQLKRPVIVPDRLGGLAPAAIENGVGRGDPRCRSRILRPHNADKDIERGLGVAACQGPDFGESFAHLTTKLRRSPARQLRKQPRRHDLR